MGIRQSLHPISAEIDRRLLLLLGLACNVVRGFPSNRQLVVIVVEIEQVIAVARFAIFARVRVATPIGGRLVLACSCGFKRLWARNA